MYFKCTNLSSLLADSDKMVFWSYYIWYKSILTYQESMLVSLNISVYCVRGIIVLHEPTIDYTVPCFMPTWNVNTIKMIVIQIIYFRSLQFEIQRF